MASGLLHREVSAFQHAHERGARNAEDIGSLLGGEAGVARRDGHAQPGHEGLGDLQQDVEHGFA